MTPPECTGLIEINLEEGRPEGFMLQPNRLNPSSPATAEPVSVKSSQSVEPTTHDFTMEDGR